MLPALTCVLLAQTAAAAVTPPRVVWVKPVKPAQTAQLPLTPVRPAEPFCTIRTFTADPALDPHMVMQPTGEVLDRQMAQTGCRPQTVKPARK
jgi:hypothetical protein